MREFARYSFLGAFAVIALTAVAAAETGKCGEWTVCMPPSATAIPTTPPIPPTPTPRMSADDRWGLPACLPADEMRCKNQCHGSFGNEFWKCVQGCLAGSCSGTGAHSGSDIWNAPDDARGCVELASSECVSDCIDKDGPQGARCRADCLSRKCPESNRTDIAREGGSPGALTCDRCVERVKTECSQTCNAGIGAAAQNGINGIGGLICERSCLSLRCGAGCSLGFP